MTRYLFIFLLPLLGFSQKQTFDQRLFNSYETVKESSITKRRIKHADIRRLIEDVKDDKNFEITELGKSIQGRQISMISTGTGQTQILLWSQMHGDEPTATAAIFDIINYLKKDNSVLKNVKVHFIPMLNPDGAELFTRRNAIGVDINRDALRLQSPESKILKRVRDSIHADFGFNLHDQSAYHNPKQNSKPATISFLAPTFNFEKDINSTRGRAMRVIAKMNGVLQRYVRGQVARYSDEFEPRAFGDNMQKWGTSTILIESGGYHDDPERQFTRKLNFVSILSAINEIALNSYETATLEQYLAIPKNDRKLFDLKIENLTFSYLGTPFTVDIGINHYEIENSTHSDFYYIGKIADIGDLSTHFGYKTINAEGCDYKVGETYPKILNDFEEFMTLDFPALLREGYTSVSINELPKEIKFTEKPMNIIDVNKIIVQKSNAAFRPPFKLGANATFILQKNGKVKYAVINGFVYNLAENKNNIINGLVK